MEFVGGCGEGGVGVGVVYGGGEEGEVGVGEGGEEEDVVWVCYFGYVSVFLGDWEGLKLM